jgi:hypothetical protein
VSSSRSEASRLTRLGPAALLLACLGIATPARSATYHVRVSYVDPNGTHLIVEGTDATYVYFRRAYSRRQARDGKAAYEDKELSERGFPFASRRVTFRSIRTVRFERDAGSGEKPLVLRFETTGGAVFAMSASELEGAEHPISPALVIQTESGPLKLPIDPLASASGRLGHSQLDMLEFPETPNRRRLPRRGGAGAAKAAAGPDGPKEARSP